MKIFVVICLVGAFVLQEVYAHGCQTDCHPRPRPRPIRYNARYPQSRLDAETDAQAFGQNTNSFGHSSVQNGAFGAQGSVRHGAEGTGWGETAARSRGNIRRPFGGAGSSAGARAFGNEGCHTDCHPRPRPRPVPARYPPSRLDAETDAEAFGQNTNSFGHSSVENGAFGAQGSVRHGAKGTGWGETAARSRGNIRGSFGGAGSSANARALGNRGSFSRTEGGADYQNGFGRSGASSTAGGSGFGHSRAQTSASGYRNKRSATLQRRYCIFNRCYSSIDAFTKGAAIGDITESAGDSGISAQPDRFEGFSTHESFGRGWEKSGAASQSRIDSNDQWGFGSINSGATADAYGAKSLSRTKSETRNINGNSFTSSQSTGQASGPGHSSAKSSAVANIQRAKRDSTAQIKGQLCLNGRCNIRDLYNSGSIFSGSDFSGSSQGSLLAQNEGQYDVQVQAASGQQFGASKGQAEGRIHGADRFGQRKLESLGFSESFGEGSFSESFGGVAERDGLKFAGSSSSASLDGGFGQSSSRSQSRAE